MCFLKPQYYPMWCEHYDLKTAIFKTTKQLEKKVMHVPLQ